MIHEIFSPLADRQLAKTCSEIFTGDYQFAQAESQLAQYGAGIELLTNPDIQLVAVQANYMEETPDGDLHDPIKLATFGSKLPPLERFMQIYRDSIGKLQGRGTESHIVNIMGNIQQFQGGWSTVGRWYGNEVADKGRSLLSAHFLGRIIGDNETLVEVLAYPEHIRQSLRLLIRDMFIATLPEAPPDFQATMRDTMLDNERLYTTVSDICASNRLLSPESLEVSFGPYLQLLIAEEEA